MRLAVAVLAAVTMSTGALATAPQTQTRQDVPVFGTGVQVVAVPVFVTDKDGRAVPA